MITPKTQQVILAQNEYYLLATNGDGTILYQEHFRPHVLTKSNLREILKILTAGKFSAYLIQVHNGSILPSEDQSWIEKFNLMRLYKAGISRVAYVSPQNIFNSLEMEKELSPGKIFRIRIFKQMSDALAWLERSIETDPQSAGPTAG